MIYKIYKRTADGNHHVVGTLDTSTGSIAAPDDVKSVFFGLDTTDEESLLRKFGRGSRLWLYKQRKKVKAMRGKT